MTGKLAAYVIWSLSSKVLRTTMRPSEDISTTPPQLQRETNKGSRAGCGIFYQGCAFSFEDRNHKVS